MPTKVGLLCQPLVIIYQGFIHSDHPGVSLPVRQYAPRLVHSRGLYTSPSCSENLSCHQARSLCQNKGKSKLPHASGGWSIQVPYSSPVLAGATTESQVAGRCREQDPDPIVSFLWYQVRSSDATLTDSVMSCQGQPSSLGQAGCYSSESSYWRIISVTLLQQPERYAKCRFEGCNSVKQQQQPLLSRVSHFITAESRARASSCRSDRTISVCHTANVATVERILWHIISGVAYPAPLVAH